jgi:glycosyltransferase involved in cell wall biosynthesis
VHRLLHVLTVPDSLIFLEGQLAFMRSRGFEVMVVTSPGERLHSFGAKEGVAVAPIELPRKITPVRDLVALAELTAVIRRFRPDIVHAHTPKGGLLGTLAAAAAFVPVRLYQMRGLPLMTATGWKRQLLTMTERVSCRAATRVICQSRSLREVAIAERLCAPDRMEVVRSGSNGVDAQGKFNPARLDRSVRAELGLAADAMVFGFVGRLVRDKGVEELAAAWRRVREAVPQARLLLVGPYEESDAISAHHRAALEADPRVTICGFRSDVARLYAAMDVFMLPSRREGFPNALLEASAMQLPVVATRIPGCTDLVVDGETGTLVSVDDANELAEAMVRYGRSPELRRKHGCAARVRALTEFSREQLWEAVHAVYARLLDESNDVVRSRHGVAQ